ncbi:hypothetical protein PIB30_069145 [Stylosanthes scabra]|uniref:Cobalamin-independent methionine synthase MetE C-terminal/archaeal domain-containing protein n=1 Tax=Stylosanthes scabra TaxID=79078 RepID=A0ABU6VLQ4_9FABA|nr:hypothetical protein [Stylosanthes scabra]
MVSEQEPGSVCQRRRWAPSGGWNVSPTSVGEGNETLLIRMWIPLPSKTRFDGLGSHQRQNREVVHETHKADNILLAGGLGCYKWYQSRSPDRCASEDVGLPYGVECKSHIGWRGERNTPYKDDKYENIEEEQKKGLRIIEPREETLASFLQHQKLLSVFREGVKYGIGIGSSVYVIHSPRIPPTEEIADRINKMLAVLEKNILWVNPDCGLKTRKYTEVKSALTNMVAAAKLIRSELAK